MYARLFSLEGKVALVTGASRGIGENIALAFAEAGADAVVASRNRKPPELENVAEKIRALGRRSLAVPANVGKKEDVKILVQKALQEFGRIDILVNNAGGNPVIKPFIELEEEAFDKVLEINVKGAFMLTKAVARQMIGLGGGRIINVTSVGGVRPGGDGLGAYCTSKAALNMMTQVMAVELAKYNILVNAIAPGSIKTEMSRANWSDPERARRRVENIKLKRFGEPDEIAGIALYLASPASSFTTGQIICVDGGQML